VLRDAGSLVRTQRKSQGFCHAAVMKTGFASNFSAGKSTVHKKQHKTVYNIVVIVDLMPVLVSVQPNRARIR
jgi:hypothetical protein